MKRFLFFSVFIAMAVMSFAQEGDKMSISTQIFLNQINGKIQVDKESLRDAKRLGLTPVAGSFEAAERESQFVASPDTIDGRVYMSAFVRIDGPSVIGQLESLGVIVQEQFLDGKLVTALIPIEKIEAVAEISTVRRVQAATMMRKATRVARQRTNTDDVLAYTADAQAAGLPNGFDGSGVVLGVIDTGIDFNHIAFKDKSGNSRIKQAYVYNGSSATTYTGSQITSSLTDDKSEDHGTHTSTTAGGSSVTVSGTTVTVTDNHANASYGGMAPGADLYLAGVNGLNDTYLANAVRNMCTYADQQGLPLVVSNSWGSQMGPHDGTGDVADIYNSLFGDSHPNRVALFAASNDAGKAPSSEGGGYHVGGTSSSASPVGSILRSHAYSNTDNGYFYGGIILNAWFRSTVNSPTVKIFVLNKSTGAVLTSTTVTPTTSGATVSGLSSYYSGTLYAFKDYFSVNGKTQVLLYSSNGLTSRSSSSSTQNGTTYYTSNYTLAVQVYPSNGSASLDMWGGNSGYFTNFLSTSGYNWTAGNDDMCVSDESMIPSVISVGAYASANGGMDNHYTIGDIADFSSYAVAAESPDGQRYPWITAPGARIISGVNHNHTASVDDYSYYGSNFNGDLVVNSSTNPYAYMEGTSMATPAAAGIVALWLQASKDPNAKSEYQNLTVNKVKQLMSQTAIHDTYTDTGANHTHFGNGKIDALAGIQEILDSSSPRITATPTSIDFGNVTAGTSTTQTFTVTGENLEGNIALAKSGNNFSIDKTSITKNNDGTASATVTVTFAPTANVTNTYTGSVTLTSSNATTVTVSLTGKGVYTAPVIAANPTSLSFTGDSGQTYTKTVTVTGSNLQGNITAAIQNDANGFYSVSPTSFNAASQTVTVTWHPTAGGTSTANLVLTTIGTGANTVTVPLTGTAQGPAITANPTSLAFGTVNVGENATKTFTVTGARLEGNITLAKSGDRFSIDKTSIAKNSDGTASATVTVTYTPTADGNDTGTVTLTSSGAEAVTVNLTGAGHVLNPTINVSKDALTFATYINEPVTQTFTVTGVDLDKTVYLAVQNDADGVFSLSQVSVTANLANSSGREITVTFTPTTLGDYSATVRLSSTGAETKYVTLSGSALEHVPALTTSTQSINFGSVESDAQATQTFTLNGEYLLGDVTLTLNDANGVFTLSDATVTKAQAEAGKTITVGFSATDETAYSGSITVSTSGLQDITIALSAEVSNGGTASDAYLNIAKYATIDEAGWNTTLVDKLYTYTQYPSDEVAWLTLPMYGAFVGAKYSTNSATFNSGSPQKWIETGVTASNQCASTTWTASDIYLGSTNYFTNTTAMAVGTNSRNSTVEKSVTFYVTNTTAVKLDASQRSTSTTYPTTLTIYECTESNGVLTPSSTVAKSGSLTDSGVGSISLEGLDETKIYKVVASQARGYLYEIGFQTPLNIPMLTVTPTDVSMRAGTNETATATFNVKGKLLDGDVNLALTDANGVFALATTTVSKANAETGTDVTVTFNAPATEGTYNGTVTLTSGSLSTTVNLTGVCKDGGTASDAYLNIAKYATIDEAGATVSGMETIYKFTEDNANAVGWLTVSNYGAQKTDATQNWFSVDKTKDTSNSWTATDVFLGDDAYFGSNTSYAAGWIEAYQHFYVTNCTQVKQYAYNRSSTSYPLKVYIYECTENADGTLTAGTTAIETLQNTTTSNEVLTSSTLEASKIYKISVYNDYSDLFEIGFQTPLNKPSLAVSPAYLEYTIEPGATETKSFTVTGRLLTEDVTLTLTDENGVYTLGTTTISAADAMAGATVSVTLNAPETMGSYRGVVNLTSGEATAREVLYGTVGDKGSAYSNYLNIAKYATIATTNWYEGIFANAYKFTPDETNEVAWLTVPAALPYYAWNYNDQNWCGVSSSASGGWYGHQWTATDVFQGYEYFQGEFEDETDTYAHMMGGAESNSTSNTTIFYGIYNVTNCSQVKAYVYNNGATSSYPAFIQIYELTENADGTLTQSETRTDIQTSYTSGAQTMTSAELDPDKIYFVAVGGFRGFTYEVAFRTPFVTKEGTLAQMVADNSLAPGYNYRYTDGNVLAVYLSQDRKTLFCKDDQEYADKVYKTADQTDYLLEMTKSGTINLRRNDYDQSNWVALTLADGSEFNDKTYVGSWLNGVTGEIVDLANPQLSLSAKPSLGTSATRPYLEESNVFIPSNFGASTSQEASGYNFFFMSPKPMEVVNVTWALWNETDKCFTEIPTIGTMNPYGLSGAFTYDPKFIAEPELVDGHAYEFVAVVARNNGGTAAPLSHRMIKSENTPSGLYTVYPLSNLNDIGTAGGGTVTGIFSVNVDGREVKEVRYIDVTGRVSKTPWRGVNIVDTIYNDGSHSTKKVRF